MMERFFVNIGSRSSFLESSSLNLEMNNYLRSRSFRILVSAIISFAMVLPAAGMVFGGFDYGRRQLALFGIAIIVVFGITYYAILKWILDRSTDQSA